MLHMLHINVLLLHIHMLVLHHDLCWHARRVSMLRLCLSLAQLGKPKLQRLLHELHGPVAGTRRQLEARFEWILVPACSLEEVFGPGNCEEALCQLFLVAIDLPIDRLVGLLGCRLNDAEEKTATLFLFLRAHLLHLLQTSLNRAGCCQMLPHLLILACILLCCLNDSVEVLLGLILRHLIIATSATSQEFRRPANQAR